MTYLEEQIAKQSEIAQREADQCGETLCVVNLNRIGRPMLVRRYYGPEQNGAYADQIVAVLKPRN